MGFYYIALGASRCHLGLQIKRSTFNWPIPTSGSSSNRSDPTWFATKPSELRHRRSTKLMVYFHHSRRSKLRDFDGRQEFHFYNSLSLPQFEDDFLKQLQNVYSWMLGGITKWWAKAYDMGVIVRYWNQKKKIKKFLFPTAQWCRCSKFWRYNTRQKKFTLPRDFCYFFRGKYYHR